MGSREMSYFFAVGSVTLTTCRLLERLGVPSGCTSKPTHEGRPAGPARSRFGPRTCHDRRDTELPKLAFVWLASGARLSDDRQTTKRRMPDGTIVCFSFFFSGVRLAGTNSRHHPLLGARPPAPARRRP